MQTQAEYLIGRFGGLTATSRALGHNNPTTVQRWKESGVVPSRHLPKLLEAGLHLDPPLQQKEFYETLGGQPLRLERSAA